MTSSKLKFAVAGVLCGIAFAASANPDLPNSRRQAADAWRDEGLQRSGARGLDLVYVRPGAGRRQFDTVVLRLPSISFNRQWERSAALGSRIRGRDTDRIRDSYAALIHEEVSRELAHAGYRVVAQPAGNAVELDLSIIDLYVNAPDLPTAARTQTYAVSAASMTLVAGLRDSRSGALMARVYDHDAGREFGPMVQMSRGEDLWQTRRTARAWAIALRQQLDEARGAGPVLQRPL